MNEIIRDKLRYKDFETIEIVINDILSEISTLMQGKNDKVENSESRRNELLKLKNRIETSYKMYI